MNITVEDAGACLKKVSVEIDASEVDKKMASDFRELARQVNLPGFRPGKAPRKVLEKKFGGHVKENVRKELIESALSEASTEHKLDFISQPEDEEVNAIPEVESGKPLSFELTMEVKPEFDLPEYKGLEISVRPVAVSDKEVDIFLRNVQFSQGEMNELEDGDKTQKGDVIVGDFTIYVGDERVAGRPGSSLEVGNDTILGIDVPEAEAAFTGLDNEAIEGTKEFTAEIGEDFPLEMHVGQEARIEVKIKQLIRPDCPELDDAMAEELGFDDLTGLREHANEIIKSEKQSQSDVDVEERLVAGIVEATSLEIPQKLAERQLSEILSREAFKLYQEGMDDKAIEEFIEKRREELPATIENEIKQNFILDEIAKKERVFVTEEDIGRYVTAMAQQRSADPQEMMDAFYQQGMLPTIRWELKNRKTRAWLRKKAKIEGGESSDDKESEAKAKKNDEE